MAAWLAMNTGREKEGIACLENMLKERSYASLAILNIIIL